VQGKCEGRQPIREASEFSSMLMTPIPNNLLLLKLAFNLDARWKQDNILESVLLRATVGFQACIYAAASWINYGAKLDATANGVSSPVEIIGKKGYQRSVSGDLVTKFKAPLGRDPESVDLKGLINNVSTGL
ncbi:hypothetical protein Tco_0694978, partial [Tanacetum coccineum]